MSKWTQLSVCREAKTWSSEGGASLDRERGRIFALCTKLVKPTEKYYFIPLGGMGRAFFLLEFYKRDFIVNKRKEKGHS